MPLLRETVADRIAQSLAERSGDLLPPGAMLARQFGVSVKTVYAALKLLAARGLVDMSHGRVARCARRQTPDMSAVPVHTRNRLEELIREQISLGRYRTGEPLPKVAYFVKTERVSNSTVLSALRQLHARNLIHKRGKKWVAGSAPPRHFTSGSQTSPVMLIIQEKAHSWTGLYRANRYGQFCSAFAEEAQRHGVRLLSVLENPIASPGDVIPAGRSEALDLIGKLGNRYYGALLAGSANELKQLREWIVDLSSTRTPVIWFDRYDEGIDITRSKYIARAHCSEKRATVLAISYLADAGHRTIAYPQRFDAPWVRTRGQLLADAALRHVARPILKVFEPLTDEWEDNKNSDEFAQHLRAIRQQVPSRLKKAIDLLLKNPIAERHMRAPEEPGYSPILTAIQIAYSTPMLLPVIKDKSITALLAYHDKEAVRYYYWLRAAGYSLPRDISLLSFDNDFILHPLPVSTVDFGFGNLGYQAFHFIFGDMPVRREKNGDISGKPQIIERDTVGPPAAQHTFTLPMKGVEYTT